MAANIRTGEAERLAALLRIPTESKHDTAETDWHAFDAFREQLAALFPNTFATLELELIEGHTILALWKGRSAVGPSLLMAHQDVVAADGDGWSYPPFEGVIDNGTLWGRGAIDDKASLAGLLEATEALITDGHVPARDVWFLFGHDEETLGTGASAAVDALARRGIRPAFVLDEGGAIVEAPIQGVKRPIAAIGVAEKGMNSIRLSVQQQGGHASTPPRMAATSRLARAIRRIDLSSFPQAIPEPSLAMFETLGAHAEGMTGFVLRNARRLQPLLATVLAKSDETRAMLSTTAVVTMLEGAKAANALAEEASAVLNVRIAVGSSVAETMRQLEAMVKDEQVSLAVLVANEPSPISSTASESWDALLESIARSYPDAIPVPYVMTGGTDSRFACAISDNVYRFTPFVFTAAERAALHARDEHIDLASYSRGCRAYLDLIETVC
ncbi:M20/M25/M40 family metallo-hydrolase [Humidisolicoccus flavus]|uniref:M20/M25/M40 family metallo-hydrolase n=1 Tax=Humidisolicoccus flavus TaxID=3111414 RepID=UPI00324AE926